MASEQAASAVAVANQTSRHSNSYDIFILVLTIFSLVIMGLLVLPLGEATLSALSVFDNLICVVFLFDFAINLLGSHPRSEYFVRQRGWLDLLGSIPSLGILRATALLRLARLSRLVRVARLLRGDNRRALVQDIIRNRGEYAIFITLLAAFLVISVSTVIIVQVESTNPDSNIRTGGDALWWAFVTITTVGYGDKYPITFIGRATAVLVMFAGVGIIGSLASILASILVPTAEETAAAASAADDTDLASSGSADANFARVLNELASIRIELAELRSAGVGADGPPATG